MFDTNLLKNFIDQKQFTQARRYIVKQIDELIEKHVPDYISNGFLALSSTHPELAGILMTYSLILEDDSNPEEFIVTRLLECYKDIEEKFNT